MSNLFEVPDFDDEDEQTFIPVGEELPEVEEERGDDLQAFSQGLITDAMKTVLHNALDAEFNEAAEKNAAFQDDELSPKMSFEELLQNMKKQSKPSSTSTETKKMPMCYTCSKRHEFGECLEEDE